MTLEQCIQWRNEIRTRTQCICTFNTSTEDDYYLELEYIKARERGEDFNFKDFAEHARRKRLSYVGY